jgi:hypothetical protein
MISDPSNAIPASFTVTRVLDSADIANPIQIRWNFHPGGPLSDGGTEWSSFEFKITKIEVKTPE